MSLFLKMRAFHTERKDRQDAEWAVAVEPLRANTQTPVLAAAPYEEPAAEYSRLDYIRRYGSVMGMCLYELHASWLPLEDRLAA